MTQHARATDLWMVRNRRIIALLGMWKIAGDPEYLEEAVAESRASLANPLPRGADVVPRFCLAKDALRQMRIQRQVFVQPLLGRNCVLLIWHQ